MQDNIIKQQALIIQNKLSKSINFPNQNKQTIQTKNANQKGERNADDEDFMSQLRNEIIRNQASKYKSGVGIETRLGSPLVNT
jgi:hypothetical protein